MSQGDGLEVRGARSEAGDNPGDSRPGASFEDLVAWQRARVLAAEINALAEREPIARRWGFRDQIERAAVSVMSNIAEGHDLGSRAEFHRMLTIARGSCAEVRSLLYVALDAGYIEQPEFARLHEEARQLSRIIGRLRQVVGQQRDHDRERH